MIWTKYPGKHVGIDREDNGIIVTVAPSKFTKGHYLIEAFDHDNLGVQYEVDSIRFTGNLVSAKARAERIYTERNA